MCSTIQGDLTGASEYIKNNLPRLLKQCDRSSGKGGDEAFSFLALFSFIEGYLRVRFPTDFGFDKDIQFPTIMDKFFEKQKGQQDSAFMNANTIEDTNFKILKEYHGKLKEENWSKYISRRSKSSTGTDTNEIRHCFSNIKPESLGIVLENFLTFFRYRNLDEELFNQLCDLRAKLKVKEIWDNFPLQPLKDSVLNKLENNLLEKYCELSVFKSEYNQVINQLNNFDFNLINAIDEKNILKIAQERKNNLANMERAEKRINEFNNYSEFIYELGMSLSSARSKKNYEDTILTLSESQLSIVKNDITDLPNKEGQSMYIKGGPGTGKTLVLIAALFKLYKEGVYDTELLSYYKTLHKYLTYLFKKYNEKKLLKDLDIPTLDEKEVCILKEERISEFDKFMLPNLSRCLRKDIYPLRENYEKVLAIVKEKEKNERVAINLFYEIIDNIWPNIIDDSIFKYTIDSKGNRKPRNEKRWEKILEIHKLLEEKNEIPDAYAYYKFALGNFSETLYMNNLRRYILIDEAQDLTNAQIYSISKFLRKENNKIVGGLILAGDPGQEIRNKRISMAKLHVNLKGGKRYNPELVVNYRSAKCIQDFANRYKDEPFLHISKSTKSKDGMTAGPYPLLFVTEDDENSKYENTYRQIISSVDMCINELYMSPSNICIVTFGETELNVISEKLKEKNRETVFIHNEKEVDPFNDTNKDSCIRLCTVKEIKGIDCPILLFMITDQSKKENNGGISEKLRANAIYTCITRTMYLLQIFIPKYCICNDVSVAALANTYFSIYGSDGNISDITNKVSEFIEIQKKKDLAIDLGYLKQEFKNLEETELKTQLEDVLKNAYQERFGTDENFEVEFDENYEIANVYARKIVEHEVTDSIFEISVSEALKITKGIEIGKPVLVPIDQKDLKIFKGGKSPYTNTSTKSSEIKNGVVIGFEKSTLNNEYYLQIKQNDNTIIPAYYTFNQKWREYSSVGTLVYYKVVEDDIIPNKKMALVESYEIQAVLYEGTIVNVDLRNMQIFIKPDTFVNGQKCGPTVGIYAWLSQNEQFRMSLFNIGAIGKRVKYEETPGRMFRDEDRPYYVAIIKEVIGEEKKDTPTFLQIRKAMNKYILDQWNLVKASDIENQLKLDLSLSNAFDLRRTIEEKYADRFESVEWPVYRIRIKDINNPPLPLDEDNIDSFYDILLDVYNRLSHLRTDNNGNPALNSNGGYLNIACCGLSKPRKFNYEKWPLLIKDYPDLFNFVTYPYTNGTHGSVFAFNPKKIQIFKDSILGNDINIPDCLNVHYNTENPRFNFLHIYKECNLALFDNCKQGSVIEYTVVQSTKDIGKLMAIIIRIIQY